MKKTIAQLETENEQLRKDLEDCKIKKLQLLNTVEEMENTTDRLLKMLHNYGDIIRRGLYEHTVSGISERCLSMLKQLKPHQAHEAIYKISSNFMLSMRKKLDASHNEYGYYSKIFSDSMNDFGRVATGDVFFEPESLNNFKD